MSFAGVAAGLVSFPLILEACSNDVTKVDEEILKGASVIGLKEKMPVCNTTNIGDVIYVTDSSKTYICANGEWHVMDGIDGENGKDGEDGTPGKQGEIGKQGDQGASCSMRAIRKSSLTGIEVACGDELDTLWSGKDGENGRDGQDGLDGENGKDGQDGKDGLARTLLSSCSLTKVASTDESRFGVEIACTDAEPDTLWNGVDGKDGKNGKDEQPYSFGSSCKLNPVVSADEIKRTGFEIVCDSLDGDTLVSVLIDTLWNGVDGKNGSIGEKGATGSSCVSTPVTLKNGQTGFEIACGSGETMTRDTLWNGKDGQNGLPGSIKSICSLTAVEVEGRTGLEIACGKGESATVDTLWNGTDGKSAKDGKNGVGCAYTNFLNEDGASGTEIICNGAEPDTVWNGTRGEPGEPGTDGDVGADCFVETDSLGIVIINCGTEENPLRSTVYKTLCYNTPYDPEEEVCDNGVLRHVVEYDEGDLQDDFDVKYNVVRIGSQMWMDNMRLMNNATTTSGDNICGGWHEDGNELTGCDARGRLYTYASATAEKLCPEGYVVPSRADWMKLFKTVDPTVIIDDDSMTVTFASETLTHLKAKRVWGNADSGDDLWGFDFIPSGYAGIAGDNGENPMQTRKTGEGFYWTSVAGSTDDTAWTLHLTSTKIEFVLEPVSRSQSVRCVKNLN